MTDEIFNNIVFSLPTLAHSVAIATRCLTDGRQRRYPTKYMPDFGGVLDIPEFVIKNNALCSGLPFGRRAYASLIPLTKHKENAEIPGVSECLIVNSYLKTIAEDELVAIRALDNILDFNLIKQTSDETPSERNQAIPFATIPYSGEIIGIRYSDETPDFLVVKFDQEVKTIKLNNSYTVGSTTAGEQVINLHACITRDDRRLIKDACLNQYNSSVQAIVSDDCRNDCCLELYDISTGTNTPIYTNKWTSNDTKPVTVDSKFSYVKNKMVSGSFVRTLVPVSTPRGVQNLEKTSRHLLNYIVTTGYRTALIDPRCNEISLVLLDKTQLMSFFPAEYCRSSLCSTINEYQFYSLSNITVRAIDMRYPGTPVNQVNHMLDSSKFDYMNLKLFNNPTSSQVETLCVSSTDSICFITFDQAQEKKFVNPKSLHQPFHDTASNLASEASMKCMHGLDVVTGNVLEDGHSSFSIFQLSNNSELYRRDFSFTQNNNHDSMIDSSPKIDISSRLPQPNSNLESLLRIKENVRGGSSPKTTRRKQKPDTPVLDIFDEDEYQEENLPSHAAMLRFEAMKEKLRKT